MLNNKTKETFSGNKKRNVIIFTLCVLCCACCALCCACLLRHSADNENTSEWAQVANPLHEVETVQEMNNLLGYSVPVLDKQVEKYIVIMSDGKALSGRICYADGSVFNVIFVAGETVDISGIYGGILTHNSTMPDGSAEGAFVSYYTYEEEHYAVWGSHGFSYSYSASDMTTVENGVQTICEKNKSLQTK